MKKRFVAWARVSSDRQKTEGYSLEDQEARLREFAGRLGGELVKVFRIAETASKPEARAEFAAFRAFVRTRAGTEGGLDGMLFAKVDRAARNIMDWAELEELADRTGVPMFFPDQSTGDTPAGRMQRRISAVIAASYTEQMAVDIRAGIRRRAEAGLPMGRTYGYRGVRVDGKMHVEIDPVRGPKVRRVFELFAYGVDGQGPLTLEALANTLAAQGIARENAAGREAWKRSTLWAMLNNRAYLGEVKYCGKWWPGAFEALVDRATWAAVRKRMERRVVLKEAMGEGAKKQAVPAGRTHAHPEFLGGLMVCGHCGYQVTGETIRRRGSDGGLRSWTYYRCTKFYEPGHPRVSVGRGSRDGSGRLSEKDFNQAVLGLFASMRLSDEERAWFRDVIRARAGADLAAVSVHKRDLEKQAADAEARLSRLVDLRIDGELSPEAYQAKKSELEERLAGVRARLGAADRSAWGPGGVAEAALGAFELSQSLAGKWVGADARARRTILEIVCERVELNSGKVRFALRSPFDLVTAGETGGEVVWSGRELNFVAALEGWDARVRRLFVGLAAAA